MELITFNDEVYEIDTDNPASKEDLLVGDLIFTHIIQGYEIKMIMEVKQLVDGEENIALVTSREIVNSRPFSLSLNHDYHINLKTDKYFKMDHHNVEANKAKVSMAHILRNRKNEYWVMKDGQKLYPNQLEDEDVLVAIDCIKKHVRAMRRELLNKEALVLRSLGANIPTSKRDTLLNDMVWAVENITIYKLLLDEAEYRELNYEEEEMPKKVAKGLEAGKFYHYTARTATGRSYMNNFRYAF